MKHSSNGLKIRTRAAMLACVLLFGACKAAEDDSDAPALAALALANVDTNCGTIDLGTTERAPANRPSFGETPLSFSASTDGSKYLAVILLENVMVGETYAVKTGSTAAAFAFADSVCPIDQGTNNADTLANSVILRTANSTLNNFTIQTAGSYALVVTANTDPGSAITLQRTN